MTPEKLKKRAGKTAAGAVIGSHPYDVGAGFINLSRPPTNPSLPPFFKGRSL